MAHFAQLNEENLVTQVIVVANQDTADQDGVENEAIGIAFCQKLLGGNWKQTSYNTIAGIHTKGGKPFRKNHAGIGYTYDEDRDAFIPKKPYNSWILNEQTCLWEAPTPCPNDDNLYRWDEEALAWVKE